MNSNLDLNLQETLNLISYRGVKPGLERMFKAMAVLGNPHQKIKCIHIAGTNGKGSVCYMLTHLLTCSGYKVGLTISPHMLEFSERIQISNPKNTSLEVISRKQIEELHQRVWKILPEDHGLTYFEYGIVLALYWFAECKVDFAVLETGMGGRWDATNIVHSILSCVTTIGLDHCEILGDTIEKICAEKIQIAKPRSDFVFGPSEPSLVELAKHKAKSVGAKFFDADSMNGKFPEHWIQNRPAVFLKNLNLVRVMGERLVSQGYEISLDRFYDQSDPWLPMSRFQYLKKSPDILLDGAHNEPALRELKSEVVKLWGDDYDLYFGCLADRNFEDLLSLIRPQHGEMMFCHFDGGGRQTPLETLEKLAVRYGAKVKNVDVELIREIKNSTRPTLICGSLYLGALVNRFWSA